MDFHLAPNTAPRVAMVSKTSSNSYPRGPASADPTLERTRQPAQ